MTDKERLEEIKAKYNSDNTGKLGEIIDLKLVNPYDLKYLIERVQELEIEIEELKGTIDDYSDYLNRGEIILEKINRKYWRAFHGIKAELLIVEDKLRQALNDDETEELITYESGLRKAMRLLDAKEE